MIWSARRTPIGVDLGARQVKALQLGRVRGTWRITAAARFARPGDPEQIDPAVVERLDDVFYRQGFRGRDVVLAVPGDRLRSGMLELPTIGPGVPIAQIAARGLMTPLPVYLGADPPMGSNIDVPSGLMLPPAAMPIPP